MNTKSSLIKITTVVMLSFSIVCCTKNTEAPQSFTQTPPVLPQVLNLVANHWLQQGTESVFTNTFSGVMYNRTSTPRVYVVTDSTKTLINSAGTTFMGGAIWSVNNGMDIVLNYREFSQHPLPFGYLNIQVVFE